METEWSARKDSTMSNEQTDNSRAAGGSPSNGGLANCPLFDFRPRAVCGSSFIYGMLTGCGMTLGLHGAMHLDGVTLFTAFFFLVFAKLAHEHIRLAKDIGKRQAD